MLNHFVFVPKTTSGAYFINIKSLNYYIINNLIIGKAHGILRTDKNEKL
jgi:hypothetical protein